VNIDFEPFKTINTSLYLCDNKFHTEALSELLESENKYGFIVMDGNGALFGTLSGNTREVGDPLCLRVHSHLLTRSSQILHKFTVDLPKKHGRGGQSALRFARLRMEKRHNYVRKARRPFCPTGVALTSSPNCPLGCGDVCPVLHHE
jgi:peptide chain release factor subunit 1